MLIGFADLRRLYASSTFEDQWITARAGQPGRLTGPGAEAEACDARIAPVVTGSVDWQVLDQMTKVWIQAHGLDHRAAVRLQLRRVFLRPAGPADPRSQDGAARRPARDGRRRHVRPRRAGRLPADPPARRPLRGKSLPLDMGKVKGIPDHLRRAVILRDGHCAWPGGCDKPPAGCQVHHVIYRSRGGKTRLKDLLLLCSYHHNVCIHRLGWTLTLHPDGTTEARSPDGEILRSHGPPTARAG